MDKISFNTWHAELKEGDSDDIIKWPSGSWNFRSSFQDSDGDRGWVPERLRGEHYEVVSKDSAEWIRLQEAKRIDDENPRLCVSDFHCPPRQFTDEFVEELGRSGMASYAVGDGARAMEMARQLYRVSRSDLHATGEGQKTRALELRARLLEAVETNVVVDDRFRLAKAGLNKNHDEAIAMLSEIKDASLVGVAKSVIAAKVRARDGRSVANMRRIGDLEHETRGALRQERQHARALIKDARKSGDTEQGIAACKQLYRIGVVLVLAWDAHMRQYDLRGRAKLDLSEKVRRLMNSADRLEYLRHGAPRHEREGTELAELSSLDYKWLNMYLGTTDKTFIPAKSLDGEGTWPVGTF